MLQLSASTSRLQHLRSSRQAGHASCDKKPRVSTQYVSVTLVATDQIMQKRATPLRRVERRGSTAFHPFDVRDQFIDRVDRDTHVIACEDGRDVAHESQANDWLASHDRFDQYARHRPDNYVAPFDETRR